MSKFCLKILPLLLLTAWQSIASGQEAAGFRKIAKVSDSENIISGSQVWSISCVNAGAHEAFPSPVTFLASNDGLFMYNGSRLARQSSGNPGSIRSLEFDPASGRLYSASSNGFGWWEKEDTGRMAYHPVNDNTDSGRNRDFWRTKIAADGKVFFQSYERICIYNPSDGSVESILPENQFRYMHGMKGRIFVQDGSILFEILPDGSLAKVCSADDRIMEMVDFSGKTIVGLERTGLMELRSDGSLHELHRQSNEILSKAKILSLTRYDSTSLLVGTTQGGIFLTDADGRIRPEFRMEKQFSGATVLSVARDANGDIWTGMEAGAARIDFSSHDYYIEDPQLGRVRAAVPLAPGILLIGSNKGAFLHKDDILSPVPGSTGSVWNLSLIDGKAYIAHDLGLFQCRTDGSLFPLYNETGVMSFEPYIVPGLYVCGTYNGLAIFEDKGSGPRFRNAVENYDGFVRNIHIDSEGRIWARDSRKGFIRLTLDSTLSKVVGRKDFNLVSNEGDPLFACNTKEGLLFCCNSDAWEIDPATGDLVPSSEGKVLLDICGDGVQSMVYNTGAWWYMSASGCGMVVKGVDGKFHKMGSILYGEDDIRNSSGLGAFGDGVICGFLNEVGISYGPRSIEESISLSQVQMLGTHRQKLADIAEGQADVPFDMNSVRFFVGGNIDDDYVEYRVLPMMKEWKKAPLRDPLLLSSLPSGNYQVEFRSSARHEVSCSFDLHILRPWFLKWWMLLFYLGVILLLSAGIREYYARKAEKERQAMLRKMEEERLRNDLKEKGKELANITFNNAKRNNQLKEIKELLASADPMRRSMDIKKVSANTIHLIDSYLEDETDWEKSEEYFNIIYDGMLDKLKMAYPGISKTDLKICVYAKLNLSTKEIADIMNISPRSVEMARWRLRKRLGLPKGQDIVDILREL
ncbi:MAG: hypothetical protein IJ222_09500 [Bacteroidales bacterium]|nr:hypothetical protein [Bacteroidales bacterium]